ncbi:MAG: hypothetical protein IJ730_07415 [Alphaproteobacteria bacterium]|nr:hypothetical protein [Alphaproteobacteria bacterium]
MRRFGINLNSIDLLKKPILAKQILRAVCDTAFDFVQLHARMTPEFYDDIFVKMKEQDEGG